MKSGTCPQLTGCTYLADTEYLAYLAVFLDDTLAVEQSETMTALNLMIEQMFKLFTGHSLSSIFYRYFYISIGLNGRNVHPPLFVGELSCVVSQSVEHEERKHPISLNHGIGWFYAKFNTFHLERCAPFKQHVEQRLKRETLNMQTQLALAQLDPICKDIIILIDLIDKLTYIGQSFIVAGTIAAKTVHLVNHTVDERSDIAYKRHLCPLFQIASLVLLYLQQLNGKLFTLLLQGAIFRICLRLLLVEIVEQPQRKEQQDDGRDNGDKHDVELRQLTLVLIGASFELTILTGGLLQVEIHITVLVALLFIVDGGIGHT